MKKLLLIFAVVLFTTGFASKVSADNPVLTVSNTAGGEIMAPITLEANLPLEFGRLAVQAILGGTVVLTPAASTTATASDGVSLIAGGATRTAAKYTVGGLADYGYAITVENPVITITRTGGGTMTITGINCLSTKTPSTTGGMLTGGSDIFYLGGTLNVAGGQTAGTYSGSFNVSVNYN